MESTGVPTVRLRVILEIDDPAQGRAFEAWAGQAGLNFEALDNEGCGCCVDIYTFASTPASALALEEQLRAVGSGVEYLPD